MIETSITQDLWLILTAGIVATMTMTLFILPLTRIHAGGVNIVHVIGTVVATNPHSATSVGWVIHSLWGIIFAFLYYTAISFLNPTYGIEYLSAGLMLGFMHGVVVAIILQVTVERGHPLRRFYPNALAAAAAYFAAHLIYGGTIGLVLMVGRHAAFLPVSPM
jgi:hypothetical protein